MAFFTRKGVGGRRRTRSLIGATALILALVMLGGRAADATSKTGQIESTAESCQWWIDNTGAVTAAPVCAGYFQSDVNSWVSEAISSTPGTAVSELNMLLSTQPGELMDAAVGEVEAQVEHLTGLEARADTDPLDGRAAVYLRYGETEVDREFKIGVCGGDGTVCQQSGAKSSPTYQAETQKFRFWTHTTLLWDPDRGCKCVDGRDRFNFYTAVGDPRDRTDYYSSSMKLSLTPEPNIRLSAVATVIDPTKKGIQLSDCDPWQMVSDGNGRDYGLSATLSGEFPGGGGFSVGLSWSAAGGESGGGCLHDGTHYAQWWARNGVTTARGASGVETWTQTADHPVGWTVGGGGRFRRT